MDVDAGFEELYRAEGRAVFTTVYLLCWDRAVAEDATQEAFARALERWERLRGQAWAAGWVNTTAVNVARRTLRRRRVPPTGKATEPDADAVIDLWRQVRRLSQAQRVAVILYYRLDLPVASIAELMQCREGTVRPHLAHARCFLRQRLREDLDEDRRESPLPL